MSSVLIQLLTENEYLARERQAKFRSEFYRGETFAMAGASREHNLIAANVARALGNQLISRTCEVYQSDMKIRISPTGLYTYPDVVVACGELQFADDKNDVLLNPTLVVEVLSESTAKYDLGRKFEFYQELDSFIDYVIVYQAEAKVIHYRRQDDGTWTYRLLVGMEATLDLESIACSLPFASICRGVEFGPEDDQPPMISPHPA